jgi:hypothetical protein
MLADPDQADEDVMHSRAMPQLCVCILSMLAASCAIPGLAEEREVCVTLDLVGLELAGRLEHVRVTADVARSERHTGHREVWAGQLRNHSGQPQRQLLIWSGTLEAGEKALIEIDVTGEEQGRCIRSQIVSASMRGIKDYITSKVPGYLAGAVSDGLSSLFSIWGRETPPDGPSSFVLVVANSVSGLQARLHPRLHARLVEGRLNIDCRGGSWLGVPRVNGTVIGSGTRACGPTPPAADDPAAPGTEPAPARLARASMENEQLAEGSTR